MIVVAAATPLLIAAIGELVASMKVTLPAVSSEPSKIATLLLFSLTIARSTSGAVEFGSVVFLKLAVASAIGASRHEQIAAEALSLDQAAAIARAWSLVHGFTMLLLDGRLTDILRRLPEGTDAETLLDAMLRSTVGRPAGP